MSRSSLYAFLMMESWKFSKGLLLSWLGTSIISFLVLGYAWSQHRSSEILTGVIGGLTVILGMLTAEWLRTAREQVELSRMRLLELMSHLNKVLHNFEEYFKDPYSEVGSRHLNDYNHVIASLRRLSRTTGWPQPNAIEIRSVSRDLLARMNALLRDAEENKYVWNLEERLEISLASKELIRLIWAHEKEERDDFESLVNMYRKTDPTSGNPVTEVQNPSS